MAEDPHKVDALELAELRRRLAAHTQLEAGRVRADRVRRRVRRVLKALDGEDAADEHQIVTAVCEAVAQEVDYLMAWYGRVIPETEALEPLAWAGHEEGFLQECSFSAGDPVPALPVRAARSGRYEVSRDIRMDHRCGPWRDAASARGYASALSLPRRPMGGVLTVYSAQVDAFSPDEVLLLGEVVEDLSLALQSAGARHARRGLESEKEQLVRQLIQAQKMEALGTLAGGVAHDFNNVLSVIQGQSELAMLESAPDAEIHYNLRVIRQAIARAAELTSKLLLFSHEAAMEFHPVDMVRVMAELVGMLERTIGEDVALIVDVDPEPWPILGDPGTLQQVLLNLAVNARDAMPEGGRLTMRVENVQIEDEGTGPDARPGRFVCVEVSDTGTGMEPGVVERLFEPFFTTKAPGRGTGLGLSVAYGIVRQHGGWIEVDSEVGRGSTFSVFLPASPGEDTSEIPRDEMVQTQQGQGERILLVEDDADVREVMVTLLSRSGYAVVETASAHEALEVFGKEFQRFDLVFTDAILPDLPGVELVARLREVRPDLKVLFTSGYDDARAGVEAEESLLPKPARLSDLLRAVRDALGGGRG